MEDTPASFEALKQTVRAQVCTDKLTQKLLEKNLMEITYKDENGENHNVSDDEDLKTAYELAEGSMQGQIDFFVKPRYFDLPNKDNTHKDKVYHGKQRERKPKKEKDATPSYQKRAFKKFIKKELNKQCDLIFDELYKLPEYHEEEKSNEAVDKLQNPEWAASIAQQVGSTVRAQLKHNRDLIDSLKNSLNEVNAAEMAIKEQLKAWASSDSKFLKIGWLGQEWE